MTPNAPTQTLELWMKFYMQAGGALCPAPAERKGAPAEDGRQERANHLIPKPVPKPLVSCRHVDRGGGWLTLIGGLNKGEGRQYRFEALIE